MNIQIKNVVHLSILLAFMTFSTDVKAQTVMQKLKEHQETGEFAQALENARLHSRLNEKGPFTLFAPSNKAFQQLTNKQKMDSKLLLNHVFTGLATERSLKAMSDITCLSGRTISINKENNNHLSVDSFVIMTSNIRADNGIIHIIDGVIQ